MLHQEGLDPIVMPLLQHPIGDGSCLLRDLKPLAECFGEDGVFRGAVPLQLRLGKAANGGVNPLDRGAIEGQQRLVLDG